MLGEDAFVILFQVQDTLFRDFNLSRKLERVRIPLAALFILSACELPMPAANRSIRRYATTVPMVLAPPSTRQTQSTLISLVRRSCSARGVSREPRYL